MPIFEYASELFRVSEVSKLAFKELKANEEKGSDPWVKVGFNLEGKVDFRDKKGNLIRPEGLTVVMGYCSNYRKMNTKPVSYDRTKIVVGGFYDKKSGAHAHIAANEEDGSLVATVEMSGSLFPSARAPSQDESE